MSRSPAANASRRAMTLVEILVVVGVIAALIAIALPAMRALRGQAVMLSSQSNLKQVATYMHNYSTDNRGYVVPSRFDYSGAFGKSNVRSASPAGTVPNIGPLLQGSWTDILWTTQGLGPVLLEAGSSDDPPPSPTWDYRYDSPDYWAYRRAESIDKNVFRSTEPLQRPLGMSDADHDALPTPFGPGAGQRELGQPGYFAANDFFDSTGGNWYTMDMIRRPEHSLYAVDSRAGETIRLAPEAWDPDDPDCEVEFRYIGGMALVLFLDGHVTPESRWEDLADLQVAPRNIRVERLDQQN